MHILNVTLLIPNKTNKFYLKNIGTLNSSTCIYVTGIKHTLQ